MKIFKKNNVIKWIEKTDRIRVYITRKLTLTFKYYITDPETGKKKWQIKYQIMRDRTGLYMFLIYSGYCWDAKMVKNIEEINQKYELHVTQEMIDLYDAIILPEILKKR